MKKILLLLILFSITVFPQYTSIYKGIQIDSAVTYARALKAAGGLGGYVKVADSTGSGYATQSDLLSVKPDSSYYLTVSDALVQYLELEDSTIYLTPAAGNSAYEGKDAAITKTDEAETISANWVNTANPWAANELVSSMATEAEIHDTLDKYDVPATLQAGVIMANGTPKVWTEYSITVFGDTLFKRYTNLPTATTIGSQYIYRAGGTDVPDADVADNITITNISQVGDITATASELNYTTDVTSNIQAQFTTMPDTLSYSWGVMDTTIVGALPGWKVPFNITIVEISSYTEANTCTFNLEERVETTPNTAGTDVLASDQVADYDQQEATSFTNAAIDINDWLVPTISATGDVEIFSITVRYVKTN